MILRLWKGRADADVAPAYRQYFHDSVLPALRRIDGFLSARLLERALDGRVEFLVASEWASWDAIRRFAGDRPDRAVVEPGAQRVLADFDTHVVHFELSAGESRSAG